MSETKDNLPNIREELEWIRLKDHGDGLRNISASKGIFGFLVPLGCVVTAGILGTGLYNMVKRDSRKQQLLMRYRVVSQGVTVILAAAGIFYSQHQSK